MKIEKFILACGDVVAFGSPEFVDNKIALYAIDPREKEGIPAQVDIFDIEKHKYIDKSLDIKNPFTQTRIEINRENIIKLRDAINEVLNADVDERE